MKSLYYIIIPKILELITLLSKKTGRINTNLLNKPSPKLRNQNKFKKSAKTIIVNLDNVKILSNKWTEETIIDESQYAGLDQLAGHPERNIKSIDRIINTIIFKIPLHGKIKTIHHRIEIDTDSLKIILALKKETNYYYDLNKPEMDFLDLDFLYNRTNE